MKQPFETVAVVGLGKIGLPLAIHYIRHGKQVIGCDSDPAVVASIDAGACHVQGEPGLEAAVAAAVAQGKLTATIDTTAGVRRADVVVVIVPVIVMPDHTVAFAAIDAATAQIGAGLRPGMLVVYETTLPVGTTANRFRHMLEVASGLHAGVDFSLAYSPERVSSGHIERDLTTYPKIVGGIDMESLEDALTFYRSVIDAPIMPMQHADAAEFVKLIETTYRDVNIALANEFARFADAHALDVATAIAAANTQPYAHIHDPGVGVGGHCIPVYPYFLLYGADSGLEIPRCARQINDAMAEYAVDRLERASGSLHGKQVLLLGIAYRGNVRETAFTSAALLRDALIGRGARVVADDPLYSSVELEALGYVPFLPEQAGSIDAIIVQAMHDSYVTLNLRPFSRCSALLDGRGALRREDAEAQGIAYVRIGDGNDQAAR